MYSMPLTNVPSSGSRAETEVVCGRTFRNIPKPPPNAVRWAVLRSDSGGGEPDNAQTRSLECSMYVGRVAIRENVVQQACRCARGRRGR